MISDQCKFEWVFAITCFALFVFAWRLQDYFLFNVDLAWYVRLLEPLRRGAQYIEDFFEVNPPLILYWYLPALFLAKIFSLNIFLMIRVYVFMLALSSFALCYFFSRRIFDSRILRNIFLIILLAIFLILPMRDFSQREHLMLIVAMPYLFLMVWRLSGYEVSGWIAALIGFVAGMGFALKPYFLLVPLLVEAYYFIHERRFGSCLRAEILTMLIVIISYIIFLGWLYPNYFTTMIPLLWLYYYGSVQNTWEMLVLQPSIVFSFFILLFSLLYRFKRFSFHLKMVLTLALVALLGSYFLQRTIWNYHSFPAFAMACLLAILIYADLLFTTSLRQRDYLLLAFFATLLIFVMFIRYDLRLIWVSFIFYPQVFFLFVATLFAISIYFALPHKNILHTIFLTTTIIFLAFCTNDFVRKSTWYTYGFLSTLIVLATAFWLLIPGHWRKRSHWTFISFFSVLIFSLPLLFLLNLYQMNMHYKNQVNDLAVFLKQEIRGQNVYFFTASSNHIPAITLANTSFISRFENFVWLRSLIKKNTSNKMKNYKNFLLELIWQDVHQYPQFVFVDIADHLNDDLKTKINYVVFLSQDPRFKDFWQHYQFFTKQQSFIVYKRIS